MAIEIYNLIWTMGQSIPRDVPVQHLRMNRVNELIKPTEGVILFPALLTPMLHVDQGEGGNLELLIATKDVLTAEKVNHQLKLSRGLHPWKPYSVRTMFGGVGGELGSTGKIEVAFAGEIKLKEKQSTSTHSYFEGVIQKDIAAALKKAGLKNLYRVRLTDVEGCLAAACSVNHCPTPEEIAEANGTATGLGGVKYCCYALPPVAALAKQRNRKLEDNQRDIYGNELHDRLIVEMIKSRFEEHLPAGGGYHSFVVEKDDVDANHFDGLKPIHSYHPLYVFNGKDAFKHANIGHLSDVHVNCRWQILKRNPARVIENDGGSTTVGDLLADNNTSFVSVLRQLVKKESNLIVLGGDLIDHIRNSYWHEPKAQPKAKEVWDAVNLDADKGGYTMKTYPPGVDLVAFYSLITKLACNSKPVFVLSGNHDCYYSAFGISPRIKAKGRANEGIPADLNMTIYEALLAFGPSGGLIAGGVSGMIPFKPAWFEWFYTVLTPFRDYRYKLPNQSLVACAWGYGEDILTDYPLSQGLGHLGRSDDAITKEQLNLIKAAIEERRTHKVILATHFTFASYRDSEPMLLKKRERNVDEQAQRGGDYREVQKVGTLRAGAWLRNAFEWGTYERRHDKLNKMLDQHHIQLVLTGHTHRRGVYRIDGNSGKDLKVVMNVASPKRGLTFDADNNKPPIVVSDSAGPYPRSNRLGEFLGWGSDKPAGTLVWTDNDKGHIATIQPVQAARPKPRAAVAVDYVDLLEDKAFAPKKLLPSHCCMMIAVVTDLRENRPRRVYQYVYLNLSNHLKGAGVHILDLQLVNMVRGGLTTIIAQARGGIGDFGFQVAQEHEKALHNWLANNAPPSRFVSLKLGVRQPTNMGQEQLDHLRYQYNWDDRWQFEVRVKRHTRNLFNNVLNVPRPHASAPVSWYSVARPTRKIKVLGSGWFGEAKYREVPNFRWRAKNFPDIYGVLDGE